GDTVGSGRFLQRAPVAGGRVPGERRKAGGRDGRVGGITRRVIHDRFSARAVNALPTPLGGSVRTDIGRHGGRRYRAGAGEEDSADHRIRAPCQRNLNRDVSLQIPNQVLTCAEVRNHTGVENGAGRRVEYVDSLSPSV